MGDDGQGLTDRAMDVLSDPSTKKNAVLASAGISLMAFVVGAAGMGNSVIGAPWFSLISALLVTLAAAACITQESLQTPFTWRALSTFSRVSAILMSYSCQQVNGNQPARVGTIITCMMQYALVFLFADGDEGWSTVAGVASATSAYDALGNPSARGGGGGGGGGAPSAGFKDWSQQAHAPPPQQQQQQQQQQAPPPNYGANQPYAQPDDSANEKTGLLA